MRVWQCVSFSDLDQMDGIARAAEELGYFGLTFGEHLVTAKTQAQEYAYSDDGEVLWSANTPWADPWVQSAALAKITQRLHFTTSVYVLPLRDAITAAKSICTASVISGGRIWLGAGAGWQQLEFDLVSRPFKGRGRHMDEQIEVMRKLWSGEMVEHHGEFYDFEPIQMSPPPPSPIPILVGGHALVALRRAARNDGWLGSCYPFEEAKALVEALKQERVALGRSLQDFKIMTGLYDLDENPEGYRALAELGVTDYLKPTWMQDGKAVSTSLAEKVAEMTAFAERFMQPADNH